MSPAPPSLRGRVGAARQRCRACTAGATGSTGGSGAMCGARHSGVPGLAQRSGGGGGVHPPGKRRLARTARAGAAWRGNFCWTAQHGAVRTRVSTGTRRARAAPPHHRRPACRCRCRPRPPPRCPPTGSRCSSSRSAAAAGPSGQRVAGPAPNPAPTAAPPWPLRPPPRSPSRTWR